MNKKVLKATIGRAEKLGCGVLITDHDLNIFRTTNETTGVRRTIISKIELHSDEPKISEPEKWKPEFDQLKPAFDALGLNLIYTDESVKLAYGKEEIPDAEFNYWPGEPERLANFLSNLYLEKSDGINGTIKIRPRFQKDDIIAVINRELDFFEANMVKPERNYKRAYRHLWNKLSATQRQDYLRNSTGEDKKCLMEVIARLV